MSLEKMTKAQLLALIKAAEVAGPEEAAPVADVPHPKQFASLGFVVTGTGPAPVEGQELTVPLRNGKTARVRVIDRIDTSPYAGEFSDWSFTYKRLRKTD